MKRFEKPVLFDDSMAEVIVTPRHSRRGVPNDSQRCGVALGCMDSFPGAIAAEVYKTVTYVEFADHFKKWKNGAALRDRLSGFDGGGRLPPGLYELSPIPPSGRRKREVGKVRGKGSGGVRPARVPEPLVRPRRAA